MKFMMATIIMTAMVMFFTACGDSNKNSNGQSDKQNRYAAKNEISGTAICPVCHMRLENVSKETPQTVYQGKTFYFMNNEMKQQFIKNPNEYINSDLTLKD